MHSLNLQVLSVLVSIRELEMGKFVTLHGELLMCKSKGVLIRAHRAAELDPRIGFDFAEVCKYYLHRFQSRVEVSLLDTIFVRRMQPWTLSPNCCSLGVHIMYHVIVYK